MRKKFQKAKKKYNRYKTPSNRSNLQFLSKSYKRCLNRHMKSYENNMSKKFRDSMRYSPKEYWKLLNKNKTTSNISPDLDTFYKFYKSMNENLRDDLLDED